MAKRKELEATGIIASMEGGQRQEREWGSIPRQERDVLSNVLTEKFMEAAGYEKEGEEGAQ